MHPFSTPFWAALPAQLTGLAGLDLVFVITALAFELLIIAILIADKHHRPTLVKTLGILWLLLAVPLLIVFAYYLNVGNDIWIMLSFGLVLLYMAVEAVLDYVLEIPFRERPWLHVPYIMLEYAALFGLIRIAFACGPLWGYLVSVLFWLMLATLIYVYWEQITHRRRAV